MCDVMVESCGGNVVVLVWLRKLYLGFVVIEDRLGAVTWDAAHIVASFAMTSTTN